MIKASVIIRKGNGFIQFAAIAGAIAIAGAGAVANAFSIMLM